MKSRRFGPHGHTPSTPDGDHIYPEKICSLSLLFMFIGLKQHKLALKPLTVCTKHGFCNFIHVWRRIRQNESSLFLQNSLSNDMNWSIRCLKKVGLNPGSLDQAIATIITPEIELCSWRSLNCTQFMHHWFCPVPLIQNLKKKRKNGGLTKVPYD